MKVKTTYPDGRVEEFEGTLEELKALREVPPQNFVLPWYWNPPWGYTRPFWTTDLAPSYPWTLTTGDSSATITWLTDSEVSVSGSSISITAPEVTFNT